jgi:hypothetical protein
MKKLIFSSLVGLALVAFTGCTSSSDAEAGAKCSTSGKCAGNKKDTKMKCAAGKCGQGKCG